MARLLQEMPGRESYNFHATVCRHKSYINFRYLYNIRSRNRQDTDAFCQSSGQKLSQVAAMKGKSFQARCAPDDGIYNATNHRIGCHPVTQCRRLSFRRRAKSPLGKAGLRHTIPAVVRMTGYGLFSYQVNTFDSIASTSGPIAIKQFLFAIDLSFPMGVEKRLIDRFFWANRAAKEFCLDQRQGFD